MERKPSKIAIIGTGAVGSTIAYSIAMKNLVSELVIIDINKSKAEGEAMDISHGLSSMGDMNVYCGDFEDIKDSSVIILTAGVGRKPGETRLDLAKKNIEITRDITKSMMKHYNSGVIIVVSNPVDVVTYIVQQMCGLPKGIVFGTGAVLDSARFRWLLGQQIGVDVKNVHGFIAGEHGDSQFPVWSAVHIGGMALDAYCSHNNIQIDKNQIENDVKFSGAEVIKRKGATYYAIASVVTKLIITILKDQKTIHHTSNLIDGMYGINDVCLSLPNIVGINGSEYTINFDFTDEELKKLHFSAEQIKVILKQIQI